MHNYVFLSIVQCPERRFIISYYYYYYYNNENSPQLFTVNYIMQIQQ